MWKVRLLGGLSAQNSDRKLTRFRTQKAASLLAFLAFHPVGHPRETLIGMLWPDADGEAGRHNLSNALSFLRHHLEPHGVPPGAVLVADRYTVGLNPEAVETDVAMFEKAVQRAGRTGLTTNERLAALVEAGELYGGSLLPGFCDEWIGSEASTLESEFTKVMIRLSELSIQVGKHDLAAASAERAVNVDPINEEAVLRLLLALEGLGQRGSALRAYRAFEIRLHEELNAEPSPDLRAVVSRLERGAEQAEGPLLPRSGPELNESQGPLPSRPGRSSLGAALFERGEETEAPRARLRGGEFLLRSTSRFFGREDETERLGKMLSSPRTRLVTLTGPGGTGKTRLAIEAVARLMTENASDASTQRTAVFVPLADISDASRLFDAIVKALGGFPTHGLSTLNQLADALEAQPNVLLVLDNFEQLVEEGAMNVQQILASTCSVKLLVTSRIKLGIESEQEFHLSALPTSAGETTPDALLKVPSIAMFVDRVQCAVADFQLTSGNADAVCQLCDYLEGLPLALELAAARAVVLSPSKILEEVQADRLDFLASRRRDRASRQRTLRATLDWSYHLMPDSGQRFLRHVSVFRGGWTMEACRDICELSESDTLSLLALLRDSSLIGLVDEEDGLRFTLLETIREYAQEQLELVDEKNAVCRRHRDYFLRFAELAETHLYGPDQVLWLERLEAEHQNFLAALSWSATEPEGNVAGLRLATALGRFWQVHAHLSEGRSRLNDALQRSAGTAPSPLRAKALAVAGVLALDQADHQETRVMLDESLTIYQKLRDERGIARDLVIVGDLARDQGLDAVARELYEKGLDIYRSLDDKRGTGQALHGLGIVALRQIDYEQARLLCTESLAIFRALGDKHEISWLLFQLGNVAREQCKFETTRALHEESLDLFRELKDIHGMSKACYSLGFAASEQGQYGAAREYLENGLALCRKLGDKRGIAVLLHHLAILCGREGHLGSARRLLEDNVHYHLEAGDPVGLGFSLFDQGRMALVQGEFETAHALFERSLLAWEELGSHAGCADTWNRVGWTSHGLWKVHGQKRGKGLTLYELGNLAATQRDLSTAREFYESALDIFVELDKKDYIARSLLSLGFLDNEQGQFESAQSRLERSAAILRELEDDRGNVAVLEALANLAFSQERYDRAVRVWAAVEKLGQSFRLPASTADLLGAGTRLSVARQALGARAFEAARLEGSLLSMEQAISLCLREP